MHGLKMTALDATRAELALLVLYLNKAEARDKICRAIQYGSKFVSNGEPGSAQNVDKSTTLARKVFRLLKFVNDLYALISPPVQGTPVPLILLGKSKNALLSTFLFLDQIVWAGRSGIYKKVLLKQASIQKEFAWHKFSWSWEDTLARRACVSLGELGRLSASTKKLEKDLKGTDKYENEQYLSKIQQSNDRLLSLIKSSMDIVVAVGLLQLAPKKVTPRNPEARACAKANKVVYYLRQTNRFHGARSRLGDLTDERQLARERWQWQHHISEVPTHPKSLTSAII
ncbi:hypothetical protein ACLOJK_006152 [Asimina triloba]